MTTSTASALHPVELIARSLADALKVLKSQWSKSVADGMWSEREDTALARMEIAIADYIDHLWALARSGKCVMSLKGDRAHRFFDRHHTRIAAIVRSYGKLDVLPPPTALLQRADRLSIWEPLEETVRVFWKSKDNGTFRPICEFSPLRTAQALMLRDLLQAGGIDPKHEFAKKGAGGERALVNRVTSLIDEGYDWWWTPDVRSAFPSIRPGHFRWLSMDRTLLLNIVFLPKCAKIRIKMPKDKEAFLSYLKQEHPDLPAHTPIMDMAILMVRRGLPQGSVLSPLMAHALIAHLWAEAVPNKEVVMLSWQDDLCVGAETKAMLKTTKEHVTAYFGSLPAGPMEFHDAEILPAKSGQVNALAYRLQPGRGHKHYPDGTRSIHVVPGPKRIRKYMRKLKDKLTDAKGSDLLEAAESYHQRWFKSHPAWTQIPGSSFEVSRNINLSYLDDFLHGQPMGCGFKSNKSLFDQKVSSKSA